MVTLDVRAEDKKRHHVTGLEAGDFSIFEQTPKTSNRRRKQTIAVVREVHTAAIPAPANAAANTTPGVYSNAVAPLKDPVPPTVLAGGRLQDAILLPGPEPAAVRLLVKDVPSGRLGSIYMTASLP